jgi:hypothetical protein
MQATFTGARPAPRTARGFIEAAFPGGRGLSVGRIFNCKGDNY